MRLDRRVEKLEAGTTSNGKYHFIRTEPGYIEDPPLLWEARHNAALTAYGRENIGPEDYVRFIHFIRTDEG